MPTATYDLIASTTLAASASSVTFGSLPQTYRDLVLVSSARNASINATENLNVQFNSDTGNNYAYVQMFGVGSGSGSSTSGTESALRALLYSASSKSYFSNGVVQIMDYSATDKHKTVISRRDSVEDFTVAFAGRWANTSVITSIALVPLSGSLATGSTFALYGIAS